MKALADSTWVSQQKIWWPRTSTSCAHPELRRPHLVHPIIFLPPGQTGGDPELGSEDRDWRPPKGRGGPPQSRDGGCTWNFVVSNSMLAAFNP